MAPSPIEVPETTLIPIPESTPEVEIERPRDTIPCPPPPPSSLAPMIFDLASDELDEDYESFRS